MSYQRKMELSYLKWRSLLLLSVNFNLIELNKEYLLVQVASWINNRNFSPQNISKPPAFIRKVSTSYDLTFGLTLVSIEDNQCKFVLSESTYGDEWILLNSDLKNTVRELYASSTLDSETFQDEVKNQLFSVTQSYRTNWSWEPKFEHHNNLIIGYREESVCQKSKHQ